MFKTEGQEVTQSGGGLNKTFEPGVVYAHIHSANVRTASTGSKALELVLEGPSIVNFEGWAIDRENPEGPKFKGQSAKVTATIYTKEYNSDDVTKNDILNKVLIISNELGLRREVDALSGDGSIKSIEQWVDAAVNILKGHDMYWFLVGKEDEYNGKIIVRLSLPKFKLCSMDETKLNKFDKTNKYHYVPFANKAVSGFEPVNNDFNI